MLLGVKLDAPTDAARALSQLDATLKKEKARGKRTRDAQSLAMVNNVVDNIVALLHTLDMEEVPLPDGASDVRQQRWQYRRSGQSLRHIDSGPHDG